MFVKPAPGLKIRDPKTRMHIPATGQEVPDEDTFWVRRLMDGDVIEVKAATTAPTKSKGKE